VTGSRLGQLLKVFLGNNLQSVAYLSLRDDTSQLEGLGTHHWFKRAHAKPPLMLFN
jgi:hypothetical protein